MKAEGSTKSFSLRLSLVNVTKSAISNKFGHIKLKKSLMRNFIFCAAADIGANMRSGAESMTFRMNN